MVRSQSAASHCRVSGARVETDPTKTGVVMSVSGEGDLAQYSVFRKIANGVIIVDEGVV